MCLCVEFVTHCSEVYLKHVVSVLQILRTFSTCKVKWAYNDICIADAIVILEVVRRFDLLANTTLSRLH